MGHEIKYLTWSCGVSSDQADWEVENNERILQRIESEIFAYICMSPDQIRAKRSRKKQDDECDDPCTNNAEYLSRIWESLKESWRETHHDLIVNGQIQSAVSDKETLVELCPKCMHQVKDVYDPEIHDWAWKCPKCGRLDQKPVTATIDNIVCEDN